VVDALKKVNYKGITKDIAFDQAGQVQTKRIFLYQVTNGTIKYLGPIDQLAAAG
jgi:branched-chain amino acid transport system substrate-binding protein